MDVTFKLALSLAKHFIPVSGFHTIHDIYYKQMKTDGITRQ